MKIAKSHPRSSEDNRSHISAAKRNTRLFGIVSNSKNLERSIHRCMREWFSKLMTEAQLRDNTSHDIHKKGYKDQLMVSTKKSCRCREKTFGTTSEGRQAEEIDERHQKKIMLLGFDTHDATNERGAGKYHGDDEDVNINTWMSRNASKRAHMSEWEHKGSWIQGGAALQQFRQKSEGESSAQSETNWRQSSGARDRPGRQCIYQMVNTRRFACLSRMSQASWPDWKLSLDACAYLLPFWPAQITVHVNSRAAVTVIPRREQCHQYAPVWNAFRNRAAQSAHRRCLWGTIEMAALRMLEEANLKWGIPMVRLSHQPRQTCNLVNNRLVWDPHEQGKSAGLWYTHRSIQDHQKENIEYHTEDPEDPFWRHKSAQDRFSNTSLLLITRTKNLI